MSTLDTTLMILMVACCTFLTRVLPFALFSRHEQLPDLVVYLGKILPATVIAILIIYCLKSIDVHNLAAFAPQLIATGIVVLLHLWKRNNLISIGLGTACYMVMVQFVF